MQADHQQESRGLRRPESRIKASPVHRRLWPILVLLTALLTPAGSRIFAQSGFVPFSNSIIALDMSPTDASIVIAGTLNVPVPAGIYRSDDGGHTWSRANADLPADTSVASIRFDPQDGNFVLAADGGVGNLFISEDGGLSWRQEPSIQQVLSPNSGIGRLFTRVENGQTVFYAGTRHDGVVRSFDRGQSWEWYGEGLSGSALRVRAFADKQGQLFAGTHDGVWRRTSESLTWERVNLPAGIIARGLTILGDNIYVGTFASGLYQSEDGVNWLQDTAFPAGVVIYDLAVSGQGVVVGTNVGLWTQGVPDWTRVPVNGIPYTNPVFRLASSSTYVGVTYAGTEQDGVLRTLDSSVSFLSSAQITPLDPAQLPRVPTPTPSLSPTPSDTLPTTETPTPTATADLASPPDTPSVTATPVLALPSETPSATATPDPNAPSATSTTTVTREPGGPPEGATSPCLLTDHAGTDSSTGPPMPAGSPTATRDPGAPADPPTTTSTSTSTPDPNAPVDTLTATSTSTSTPDPNAPADAYTATSTATATPDPNAPEITPVPTCTPSPPRDSDRPAATPEIGGSPTPTPNPKAPPDSSTVTPVQTPLPPPVTDDTPTSTPTTSASGDGPPPSATSPAVGQGNLNQSLTRIPPIWVGGAAVFFFLVLVAGISFARGGGSGTDEL